MVSRFSEQTEVTEPVIRGKRTRSKEVRENEGTVRVQVVLCEGTSPEINEMNWVPAFKPSCATIASQAH